MNGDDVGKYNSARFKNWKNKGKAKFWSELIFGTDRNCFSGH